MDTFQDIFIHPIRTSSRHKLRSFENWKNEYDSYLKHLLKLFMKFMDFKHDKHDIEDSFYHFLYTNSSGH